jgi:hypothetical protein
MIERLKDISDKHTPKYIEIENYVDYLHNNEWIVGRIGSMNEDHVFI